MRLSDRDLRLLSDLYDNNFLSFYQIHENHFNGRAKPTVYNRLSKLITHGIIEARRVYIIAHHRNNQELGVVYRITPSGIKKLSFYTRKEMDRSELPPLAISNLYHELLLTDVLRVFKRTKSNLKITNCRIKKKDFDTYSQIPDGEVLMGSDKKLAIELELSAKSHDRYREIIVNYMTDSNFDEVIYITKDVPILKKVAHAITGHRSFDSSDDTGKFKLMTLHEFFNAQLERSA